MIKLFGGERILKNKECHIILGKNHNIEKYVILGCMPFSKIKNPVLKIDDNAFIKSHSVIYTNSRIGKNFKCGHSVLIRENTTIGNDCLVGSHSIIEKECVIGNHVIIQSSVYIPNCSIIDDNVFIGPRVCFTNDKYMLINSSTHLKGPHIEEGVRIGANSTLLPGINIGKNTIIGAGSVVTKNIPKNKMVYGNPARIIENRLK